MRILHLIVGEGKRVNPLELAEEKQRSKPLEFGKSSKVWEESTSSRGEHNCCQIRPKGRSGPLKFSCSDSSRREHRRREDLDRRIFLRQSIAIGSIERSTRFNPRAQSREIQKSPDRAEASGLRISKLQKFGGSEDSGPGDLNSWVPKSRRDI
jgi:hypothetical protein